jgi:hypothetical protein
MPNHGKQHTIPRSYLASWIDPVTPTGQTGAIWRISKDRSEKWRRSPEKTFRETDRYTIRVKDGTRDLSVESTLGQTETDFQPILMNIRRRQSLTALQRAKLAIFTAAMMGRSKKQGNHWLAQWIEQVGKVKRMEGKLGSAGERPLSEQLEQGLENSHANTVMNIIRAAAPVLSSMTLTILTTSDTDGFITSDAPAVMYNPTAHRLHSSSNSPTHHIFFPPWLEVMAFQQNSNGLSAHAGNKFAFDYFLGQQPHRPAGPPLWRRRTHHGDNALLFLLIQTWSLARARCIKQCALQAAIDVPSSDLPHGLGRKPEVDTHRGRGLPLIHLTQG